MSNNNRKVFDSLVSRTKIYLFIILILFLLICFMNTKLIVPSIILYLIILGYAYFANNKRRSEISEQLQDLTLSVDSAAKTSLIHSPFPLVILETDGNTVWRSSKFNTEFANIDINNYLNDLTIDIKQDIENREDKKNKSIEKHLKIGNRTYKIIGEFVKSKNHDKKKNKDYMVILYFIDETDNLKLIKEYNDSKSCIGIIMVDNYEETMQRIDNDDRPLITAELEKTIYEWANETNGIIIKTEKDRYIYLFEQKYLETIKENKFSILDTIKEIDAQEKNQFTLSIAVSNEGHTDKEKYKSAQATMDIVLGRGGDQAAIRENEKYQFFGGRAEEVEKRTKVKARIVAHALEELMQESKNVIIMGHTNPDIDALGSSLGIYRLAKSLEKETYILTDLESISLNTYIEEINKDEEYEGALIDATQAEDLIDKDSLLIVVDTHKINYTQAPNLLTKTNKIVVIDHHRRSTDYIEQSTLTFQEVYASSSAELVTELLQYAETKIELKTIEAEGLYAGIMVDTKNFTFKTGVRTFEAAAYLRKCGIDIIRIKKWFQSDLDNYNKIAEIVKTAELVNGSIGISICREEDKDVSLICAKAADELLTISNITASFVIGTIGEKVCISGRSIGDINVQVILEKLGGGGHITLAGAQVEGKSKEEVKQELIAKIDEYFEEIVS